MAQNDKFLDAYRALENELKCEDSTVLDYENNQLDGLEQERLKVCRIMRNYIAHNDTTFLTTSNEQVKFLNECINNIRKKSETVAKSMKKVKTIKATEQIKNIIPLVDKNNIVPMETPKGIYLIDKDILIHQLALGNKKVVIPARLPKYNYVSKEERLTNITNGIYIVTNDGTQNGTYIGILNY